MTNFIIYEILYVYIYKYVIQEKLVRLSVMSIKHREAVDAPPWLCSRPGWMRLWATWSSGRCLCPWQGAWN